MNAADDVMRRVSYGVASPPPGEVLLISPLGFEATLERLREAIALRDLWLLHEVNPQMLLARDDYAIEPARQLLFFHPRYAARLLALNPAALIEIPLKAAVLQLPDGRVLVRYTDVEARLGRYPGMEGLTAELAAVLRGIGASLHDACAEPVD